MFRAGQRGAGARRAVRCSVRNTLKTFGRPESPPPYSGASPSYGRVAHQSHQLSSGRLQKWSELSDEVAESGEIDLLLAIAQGFGRVRMNLN